MSSDAAFTTDDPTERLIMEQALLFARALRESAEQAADGTVLACAEKVALHQGRELVRKSLLITLQAQAAAVEKKGVPRDGAVVAIAATTKASPRRKC
jgi:hypothetical protein